MTIHPGGFVFLFIIGWLCYNGNSLVPLLWAMLFMGILVPVCFMLHRWNLAEDEKMLREFPYDPYIQGKYRDKKKSNP